MTEMFGEAWSPMSVPDLAPDDDDESIPRLVDTYFLALSLLIGCSVTIIIFDEEYYTMLYYSGK